jgi:hypothetical protein
MGGTTLSAARFPGGATPEAAAPDVPAQPGGWGVEQRPARGGPEVATPLAQFESGTSLAAYARGSNGEPMRVLGSDDDWDDVEAVSEAVGRRR